MVGAYDPLVRLSSQVLTQVAPKTGDYTTISDERTAYNTLSQPVSVVNMLGGQGQCFDYTGYGELSAAWTQYATSATPTCVNKGPTDASWVVDNANAGAPYYQSWTFDAATGNTASRTEGNKAAVNNPAVSTFGYGVAGHANAVKTLTTTGGTSPGTTTYDYTAAGSRNTGTGNATNQQVQWNVLNQPTAVTEGAVTTTNVYGPDGARMVRANPSTVAVFVGDTQFTYDTTSKTTTAYRQYGLAGVLVGYRDTSVDTNLRWSAADGQGSGVLQVDPATLSRSGGFTRASYTPYGTQRPINGTWQSDYKWLNQPLDPSTGLVQTGARLYDPTLGQFISADPLLNTTMPNPYVYAGNNPTTFSDPSGLWGWGDVTSWASNTWNSVTTTVSSAWNGFKAGVASTWNSISTAASVTFTAAKGFLTGTAERINDQTNAMLAAIRDPGKAWQSLSSSAGSQGWGTAINNMVNPMAGFSENWDALTTAIDTGDPYKIGYAAAGVYGQVADVGTEIIMTLVPGAGWAGKAATTAARVAKTLGSGIAKAVRAAEKFASTVGKTAAKACSFSGATLVLMADGTSKAISLVEVGDQVLATDPETGEHVAKTVEHVWEHDDTLTDLVVDGQVITTTEDHPFWNATDHQFQRADQLDPGDRVEAANGSLLTVTGLNLATARKAAAYNLTIADIHTYHVGNNEILVHNDCGLVDDAASAATRVHGNSANSPATTFLYRLNSKSGEYLKTGVTNNPNSRYSGKFMQDKEMEILTSGPRREMLNLERFIVERDPGVLDRERWAGAFADDIPRN